MSTLTSTQITTQARVLGLDSDTNNPGVTDAQILAWINHFMYQLRTAVDDRVLDVAGNALFGLPADGTRQVLTTVATQISEFLAVRATTDSILTYGFEVEIVPWAEVMKLHEMNPTVAHGRPLKAAVRRENSQTASLIGLWAMHFYPPTDGTWYLSADVKEHPTAVNGTTVTTPDVNAAEAYWIALRVGAMIALNTGREPAYVQSLLDQAKEWEPFLLREDEKVVLPRRHETPAGPRY